MNHFCTITTKSHLYKVFALRDSLCNYGNATLHVLIIDETQLPTAEACIFYTLSDISESAAKNKIITRYRHLPDKLRWSMKPVFLQFLLQGKSMAKCVYVDNDIFFHNRYDFLFGLLDQHSILLTPHHYKRNPELEQNWFEANFRVGLYNAGFIGASDKAMDTLGWWANCCAYRCEKNPFRGLFDDQKYLDLVPIIDENAHIIRHPGCNLAGWNASICKRSIRDGKIYINEEYVPIFVHYNHTTIREILEGDDNLLATLLNDYTDALRRYSPGIANEDLLVKPPVSDKLKLGIWRIITEFGI